VVGAVRFDKIEMYDAGPDGDPTTAGDSTLTAHDDDVRLEVLDRPSATRVELSARRTTLVQRICVRAERRSARV
jgi:hypothetical protein